MEEILGYSRTLSLPVKPHSSRTVVDMVSPVYAVDRRMHLDTADLCSGQILLVVYMMDMIILYDREYSSQMSHYACLATVMYIAPSYYMRSYPFLCPPLILSLHDIVPLCLGPILSISRRPLIVIIRLQIFTERNAGASGIAYLAVLYDPSL